MFNDASDAICWGKYQRETGLALPLIAHCADVATCCVALLGLRPEGFHPTVLNRRLAQLAGQDELDETQVARLGALAALHDIGKCNHGFQNKRLEQPSFTAGHVAEVWMLLRDSSSLKDVKPWQRRCLDAIGYDTLALWMPDGDILDLLGAAIAHHGRPTDPTFNVPANQLPRWWQATASHDPFASMTTLRVATRDWLPSAWQDSGTPLPARPQFQHAFCGLVQLADWLGSDTDFFPLACPQIATRWAASWATAAQVVRRIGLDADVYRAGLPTTPGFHCIAPGFAPRPMQEAVGALPLPTTPSLTCIEEETGGGKTESALWHFARLFAVGAVDGMYFALPTRTAATQIYKRIIDARDVCFPDPNQRPAVILAVPGYLGVDGVEGHRLPGFEVQWNDDADRAALDRRWAAESPKRYLAGCIVVGTVDQALLAALMVDHAHLRAACLLRLLLVVDEVHASDTYMTRLLAALLERTRQAGGHALLMSATLGASTRDTLLKHWWGQRRPPATSLAAAVAVPYPTLLSVGPAASATVPFQSIKRTGRDRRVVLATANPDDYAALARWAIEAASVGARVLIIRNTVKGCLATQTELESVAPPELLWRVPTTQGLRPVPHHARYAREDRQFLDHALEQVFGKDARRDGGCIACATQTVQQALDLDADLMATDLAPVDVLLQRLGRLHRHQRERPVGYTQPVACVLLPDNELLTWANTKTGGPHGWGGRIYDDLRVLEATRRLVQEGAWDIPADNRRLVEQATHAEALAIIDAEDERWAAHRNSRLGARLHQREQARVVLLPEDQSFTASSFPDGDLAIEIRTRLGEQDRRIVLPQATTSPFGQLITALTLPAHWCRGLGTNEEPVITGTTDGMVLQFEKRCFSYDRLGLRPETHHGKNENYELR